MMADVRRVWREYVKACGGGDEWTGRMEVLLAIEGRIRMLREIQGTSLTALSKEEVISTLETLLNSFGDRERVETVYEMLDKWRVVRWDGTESSSGGAVPEDTLPLHPSPAASPGEGRKTQSLADLSSERTVAMRVDPDEERKPS